jgi:WD40 repeat protein
MHFNRHILSVALLLIVASASVRAQRLTVSRVDTSRYPEIHAFVYALDAEGKPIGGLSAGDFAVTENGSNRTVSAIDCPSPRAHDAISSVLTIDVSGSMAWSAKGAPENPNISLARAAATAWVAALPEGSDCALSTFDDGSLISQDFTSDKSRLLDAILALKPLGGTNYDAGLIGTPAGGITIASGGKHKRIVVFLTDGRGGGDENAIVEAAAKIDATVFCVTLGMPAPDLLKHVAQRTGGEFFENVTTVDEAQSIYRAILYRAQGGQPCELTWQSDPACSFERLVTVAIPSRSLSSSLEYTSPSGSIAHVELDPPALNFGRSAAGAAKDLNVTLTAVGRAVTVRAITPLNPGSKFSVSGVSTPFTLAPGERKTIAVRYAPTDTGYAFSRWRIESDACTGSTLFASGGSGRTEPSIHLIRPNGGEVFHAGEDATITWEGVGRDDTVRLEYSIDAGSTWRTIAPRTAGLSYRWKVPATPSNRCLARVAQIGSGAGEAPPTTRHQGSKTFAIHPDGSRVAGAVGEKEDTIAIWSLQDGRELQRYKGTFSRFDGMDGMIKSLEYSPDGKMLLVETHGGKTNLLDAESGRLIRTFDGNFLNQLNMKNNADNAPVFSPDGSRVLLLASSDLTAGVWDVRSGRRISTLAAEPGTIYTAAFTPDGKEIVTTGKDRTAGLWNAYSGALVRSYQTKREVSSAVAGPDGSTVAAISDRPDDSLRIWNRASDEMLMRIYMGASGADHIPLFTPDGAIVVTWPNDIPTFVDARSGAVIRRLIDRGSPRTAMYATFSRDGSMIATYGFSGIVVWDVATGEKLTEFTHKGNSIGMRAVFTPDGSVLVWSYGEYIEIGTVTAPLAQEDRSDNLWSIVVDSRPAGRDIDFGRRVVGTTADSLVVGYIRNEGTGTLKVDDIAIGGAHAKDFSLVSGIPPFEIAAGGSRAVEFSFTPSSSGARTASVEIDAGGTKLTQSLRGEGVRPQLRLEAPAVNFGETLVGSDHDTTVTALLRNTGSAPVQVRSIATLGPDTTQFRVVDGGGSFTLPPGGTREMTLRFSPSRVGRTSTRLAFTHNGIGSQTVASLYGRGVLPGEEEEYVDPTTFRTISVPNAILPKKGSIVTGVYDVVGVMAGYAITDNVMLLGGGAVPLPDDWGGVKGTMYGAFSFGVKAGLPVADKLDVAAGFQWARSIYDQDVTPGITESVITANVPYGAISYGTDDSRVSATFGYAYKHHDTPAEKFDREAGIIAIGGDYRFATRWKIAAEVISMRTLGYIPVAVTARFFGHTWALDFGLGYLGIGDGPSLKVAPVVSWVAVW